ncbi:MAG TPA: hypothetical protein VKQ30_16195 [Ktedonobacterales bacterium]|nr:hypothetical protein [Ktedonobacterales bacterium]
MNTSPAFTRPSMVTEHNKARAAIAQSERERIAGDKMARNAFLFLLASLALFAWWGWSVEAAWQAVTVLHVIPSHPVGHVL